MSEASFAKLGLTEDDVNEAQEARRSLDVAELSAFAWLYLGEDLTPKPLTPATSRTHERNIAATNQAPTGRAPALAAPAA